MPDTGISNEELANLIHQLINRLNIMDKLKGIEHQLTVIDKKVNLLVENAGMGDKLEALAQQLHGPTEALKAAVAAQQQPPAGNP